MVKYKYGDLLANVKDLKVFIAHGCNCKGVMGSGFALQVKTMYPKAYEQYRSFYPGLALSISTSRDSNSAHTVANIARSRSIASPSSTLRLYLVTKTKWTCIAQTTCLPLRNSSIDQPLQFVLKHG